MKTNPYSDGLGTGLLPRYIKPTQPLRRRKQHIGTRLIPVGADLDGHPSALDSSYHVEIEVTSGSGRLMKRSEKVNLIRRAIRSSTPNLDVQQILQLPTFILLTMVHLRPSKINELEPIGGLRNIPWFKIAMHDT